MKKAIKALAVSLSVISMGILGICSYFSEYLPNRLDIGKNNNILIQDYTIIKYTNYSEKEINANTHNGGRTTNGKFTLLNIIPIKDVNVHSEENKYVIPCGTLFGVKLYTKGVVVINCDTVTVDGISHNPGKECGLEEGDTIISVNDKEIESCKEMQTKINESNGQPIDIKFSRNGSVMSTELTPVQSSDNGIYRAGLWIRDSCAGLGTMTFYDPDTGSFAALGHGICDADTNTLLPLDNAEIVGAEINSITKGTNGMPGAINGYFSNDISSGEAVINTETGLYGKLYEPVADMPPIRIAQIHEVKKGNAQILCTLDDTGPQYYDIEITRVNYDEENKTKNLEITTKDERLINLTGGIVQGMSGSPIIQDDKLVGAVTHVLISDSN
ncbi:MAG: SpoIVB peptidase, partial [Lachnospiraceae bacterium]|nr:SpoIVB peptidase [Lachnospiraceae bacterium]